MSMRAFLGVALALVVLTVVALIAQRPATEALRTDTAFAPNLRARFDNLESVGVARANDEVVATLIRNADGWGVAERGGYPADTVKIRTALTALADARVVEEKTANPDLHGRLGLDLRDPDGRAVAITLLPDDPATPTLILGDSEGTSYRYARLANDDQTFLIDVDPDVPSDTTEWLVPQILNVPGDRIERIVITHADGERVELTKSEVGQANYDVADIPSGRELQYPGVANVIGNALRDLRLEDVAALSDSEIDAEVVSEFTTFDGLIVTARGLRIDDEGWLAFSARPDTEFTAPDGASADITGEVEAINGSVAGWRYRIPSYQYNQMARRMDDLLRKEAAAN